MGGWWAKFRSWPWWGQALLWIVWPVPLALLAASKPAGERRNWWALAVVGAIAWIGIGLSGGSNHSTQKVAAVSPTTTTTIAATTTTERITPVLAAGQPDFEHPSSTLTPGATIPGVTADQVCVSGYSSSVRDVSDSDRDQVFAEYKLTGVNHSDYEVDHLIPLELGGSNDLKNLWPQPRQGSATASKKDAVENQLHSLVCSSALPLADAQTAIVHWDTVNPTSLTTTTTTQPPTTTTEPPATTEPPTTAPPVEEFAPPPPTQPRTTTTVAPGGGATARCNDGTYSYAEHHQGACSHHGGVAEFYK